MYAASKRRICTFLTCTGTLLLAGCLPQGATPDVDTGNSALKAPRRVAPAADAGVRLDNLRLSWIGSAAATEYQVYLGVDPNPPLLTTVTTTSYVVRDLPECSTIYWRVVAVGVDSTVSGPTWRFETKCD